MSETDPLTPLERELVEALRRFVDETTIMEPNGAIIGLERGHFEQARAALAKAEQKEKGNG